MANELRIDSIDVAAYITKMCARKICSSILQNYRN